MGIVQDIANYLSCDGAYCEKGFEVSDPHIDINALIQKAYEAGWKIVKNPKGWFVWLCPECQKKEK